MKFLKIFFLLMFAALSNANSEQAVTWKKVNQERIRDVKNIFLDQFGAMYYSAYSADNNKWSINFTQDFKTYQKMELEDVDSPEKFIKRGGEYFAITTSGKVYHYDAGNSMWLELPIPDNYQTNDILFTENKMLLLPKFGYIYSSTNNGQSWQAMNQIQLHQSFYYGASIGNTIYLLRGNTVFYSSDEGNTWNFVFPPQGIDAFIDLEIFNNELYLVDNNNKFYKLENNQLNHLGTMNKTVYSFTINQSGSAVVLTNDAVYVSGSSYNAWNKIYDLYEDMPISVTYILKNRKINTGDKLYFAVPPNDIIMSEDQGQTWSIIKKDMQNVNSKMTVTNSLNHLYSITDKKLFVTQDRAKSWYEVPAPAVDNSKVKKIMFASNNALIASIENEGIKVKLNEESTWQYENEGLTNLNIIDFAIASNGNIFAAASNGIYKAHLPEFEWELINTDIITSKIDLNTNGKVLAYSDKTVYVIEHNGQVLNTYDLSQYINSNITDIEHSTSGFWISTSNDGFYLYHPDVKPEPVKITKGIISDNINRLVFQNGIIWAVDDLNNIYISDNSQDFFQINNIESADAAAINSLDKTFDNKLIASVIEQGLFIADEIDLNKFNTQYVWINNEGNFQHNFQADRYRFLKYSPDGKSIYAVCDKESTSYIKKYDTKTGALVKELPVSYTQSSEGCPNFNYLADNASFNEDEMFFAVSYKNCAASAIDSVRLYNFSQDVIKRIISPLKGSDTTNTILELYQSRSISYRPNKLFTAISVNYAKGVPPAEPTELFDDSHAALFNTNSGDTIRTIKLSKFANGKSGRITAAAAPNFSSIAAVAKSIKYSGTNEQFTDIDIIDTEINLVKHNIPLTNTKSVNKIILSNEAKTLFVSLGRFVYDAETQPEDNYGEILKINPVSGEVLAATQNFKAVDMLLSPDSATITAVGYSTVYAPASKAMIYFIDMNTFKYIDSLEIDKEHIGIMTLNENTEYIAISGRDGRIRLFKNPMASNVLKAAFTADKQYIKTGETVKFQNLSTNYPQTFEWDFGDGEKSSQASPEHKYNVSGYYTVTLKVSKNGVISEMKRENYISVYEKLNLSFTANKTDGFKPLTASFTNTSTGTAESWLWEFGDGKTSTERNPTNIYLNAGKYTVKLYAKNKSEEDSLIKVEYINVDEPPANYTVDFTADKPAGELPLNVTFTPLTNPSSTNFIWDFGDANTSNLMNPNHTFNDYGSYSISLKASKEGYGNNTRKVGYISVMRPPLSNLIIDNEYEETLFHGNQIGLSAVEAADNRFFIDYYGDTLKAKSSGILDIDIANSQKRVIPTALNGNAPSPRFITYNGNDRIYLITNTSIENKSAVKFIAYNLSGSIVDEYSYLQPGRNLTPLAMLNDAGDNIMAAFNDAGSIKIMKLDVNNQMLINKDYFLGKAAKTAFVKILNRENDYLIFYKNSINENPSVMQISKAGDSLANHELYNDKNYWFSDVDVDSEGNFYVCGNYKFSPELSSLHSFVIKYNSNFELMAEHKYEGVYTINAVKHFIDRWGIKHLFAAGSANNKLAFFILTPEVSPNIFYQYNNRPGVINSMIYAKDKSILAVGTLINNSGRNNLYALKISALNTFSTVEDYTYSSELKAVPNPTDAKFSIDFNNEMNAEKAIIKISNVSGEQLEQFEMYLSGGINNIPIELNSSNYSSGVYLIEIQAGINKYFTKIVKM